MEREYRDTDSSQGEITFIAQSDKEIQQLHRTFVFPSTYELQVKNVVGMRVTVGPVLKPTGPAVVTEPAPGHIVSQSGVPDAASLEAKTKKQLAAYGVEIGLPDLDPDAMNKAELIAAIVAKLKAPPAAA